MTTDTVRASLQRQCPERAVVEHKETHNLLELGGQESALRSYGVSETDYYISRVPVHGKVTTWLTPYERTSEQRRNRPMLKEHGMNGCLLSVGNSGQGGCR
jgi:hypothetical protein